MILEGLMKTENEDGTPNVSPMGPRVDADWQTFVLRPFRTSTTYRNVKRTGRGIFHVTDDVEMLARGAIGRLQPLPPVERHQSGGFLVTGACRWYALETTRLDDESERTTIEMRVVDSGVLREFFGLNRAKHAVVEASILATRLHLLDEADVLQQFAALRPLVEKTAGPAETRAFAMLDEFVRAEYAARTKGDVGKESA